jgi:hypothetical protein
VPPMSTPPAKAGGGLFTPRNIIIALVVLLFVCCCCSLIGVFAIRQIQAQASSAISNLGTLVPEQAQAAFVASAFMTNLSAGNWAGAYALCTPTLQNQLGSAPALGQRITNNKVQPTSFTLTDMNPGTPFKIDGTTVFSGSRPGTLHLELERVGSSYQISGFLLQ